MKIKVKGRNRAEKVPVRIIPKPITPYEIACHLRDLDTTKLFWKTVKAAWKMRRGDRTIAKATEEIK